MSCLAFSHDGKALAAGTYGLARLIDPTSGRALHTIQGASVEKTWVKDLAFSPDDKLLAVATEHGVGCSLWSVESGDEACPPLKHETPPNRVLWRDNATLVTAGGRPTQISLWDRHGKSLRRFDKPPGSPNWITSLSVFPDKEQLFYTWDTRDAADCKSGWVVFNLAKPEMSRNGNVWEHHFQHPNTTLCASPPTDG